VTKTCRLAETGVFPISAQISVLVDKIAALEAELEAELAMRRAELRAVVQKRTFVAVNAAGRLHHAAR